VGNVLGLDRHRKVLPELDLRGEYVENVQNNRHGRVIKPKRGEYAAGSGHGRSYNYIVVCGT
jgi:hypothetical protein